MVAGRGAYNRDVDGNPALLGEETEAAGVQAAVLRFDKTIVYEWAIPLFESFPDKRLQIRLGETVGFDVAVVDADDWAGGNWVSWTPESRKAFSSDLLGDLVFVQDYYGLEVVLTTVAPVDYSDIGTIVGKVTRPDQSPRSGVRVRVEDQNGRIQGEGITGLDGGYRIWLHPGTYQVIVVDARGVEPVEVTLSASGEVEDVDFAPTAIGPTIPTWPFTTGLGILGVAILACMVPLFQRRGRLGGVLLSPGDTFREVAAQPDWVGPFFLVLVSSLLISVTMTGKMLSAMGDFGGGMPGGMPIVMMTVMPLLMMAAALIFSYLAWLVRAGLIWAFARITGEQTPFYPLLSVVGYALVPEMLLGGIVMACAVVFGMVQLSTFYMMSSLSMPTSLAGLFSGLAVGNDPIRALLWEIELFSLWSLVLTIVGVQRVYGFPMGKAGIIVVLYWLLVVGTVVGFVALANAVQQMMTGG